MEWITVWFNLKIWTMKDRTSNGTTAVTNRTFQKMVLMWNAMVHTALLSVPLDGDQEADGEWNAKLMILGHILNSLHVSRVRTCLRNWKAPMLLYKIFSERTFRWPKSSAEILHTNFKSKTVSSNKAVARETSNANVEMVKMVIRHGKNHATGPSRESHGLFKTSQQSPVGAKDIHHQDQ